MHFIYGIVGKKIQDQFQFLFFFSLMIKHMLEYAEVKGPSHDPLSWSKATVDYAGKCAHFTHIHTHTHTEGSENSKACQHSVWTSSQIHSFLTTQSQRRQHRAVTGLNMSSNEDINLSPPLGHLLLCKPSSRLDAVMCDSSAVFICGCSSNPVGLTRNLLLWLMPPVLDCFCFLAPGVCCTTEGRDRVNVGAGCQSSKKGRSSSVLQSSSQADNSISCVPSCSLLPLLVRAVFCFPSLDCSPQGLSDPLYLRGLSKRVLYNWWSLSDKMWRISLE